MSLRDNLLVVADSLRALPNTFGLRRYSVTLRRRVWSGATKQQGTPVDQDIVLSPPPKVRDMFSGSNGGGWMQQEYILQHGHVITDRYFMITKITPAYVDQNSGRTGGYTPAQIRMEPPPDSANIECLVILLGDDGVRRECAQLSLDLDRAFGYGMMVKEEDRPTTTLRTMSLTLVGLQLVVAGTFDDGQTHDVTASCTFTTDAPGVASPLVTGLIVSAAPGTANLTAKLGKVTSNAVAFTR